MVQACNNMDIHDLRAELERHEDAARMFCEVTNDLNNLLTAMKGLAQLAKEDQDDQEFRDLADLVLENSSKAQNVIQLGLSRIAKTEDPFPANTLDSIPDPDVRILVVDDEPTVRDLLNRILSKKGYAVLTAATGTEAIAHAKTSPFDIAFLDLKLGDKSGVTVLKKLRDASPHTHVALMSGDPSFEQLKNNGRLGHVASFIKKPFEIHEINDLISSILTTRHSATV